MTQVATDGRGSKLVYDFDEGDASMRDLLGGKGANLAEMTRVLGPERIPAGFTITTDACRAYFEQGALPAGLRSKVDQALARLERRAGRALGDPADPLLVSVRSGARVSMPGMMDTVLNLGIGPDSVRGLAERTSNPRFAWDCYRRFLQMFGNVVLGVPGEVFEGLIAEVKREAGVEYDAELGVDHLQELVSRFAAAIDETAGEPIPTDPREQLDRAITAVFESWNSERAIQYRRLEGIPNEWGTAVNVQEMVFGNTGDRSGSGVAFSRDGMTGAPAPSGDFLFNAQGEDVVSGVRRTLTIDELGERMPGVHAELIAALRQLERHYGDMQDVEFTVEDGRLYLLQTRAAKRPAQAALRFACDAVAEGLLTRGEALRTIPAESLESVLHPTFAPGAEYEVAARGVPASPGAAKGAIVFTAEEAIARAETGEDLILVRPFTEADDVAGFAAARGILTSEGGRASHAALVARGMGRPCVAGADVRIDLECGELHLGGRRASRGTPIAIDGSTGVVTLDDVPFSPPAQSEELRTILAWADEHRRLGVRANADTPEDARRALENGAEGIGLCRTEHMFFGADRDHLVREAFIAAERWRRAKQGNRDDAAAEAAFEAALAELETLQRADFREILTTMAGRPVTIRLLDPPLHEFLSVELFRRELEQAEADGADGDELERRRERLELVEQLQEANPMLGTRGGRLGLLFPRLYEMQVAAILGAAAEVREAGHEPVVEIMIPLVAFPAELRELRALVERLAASVEKPVPHLIGTMIELPRACLDAGRMARHADFFSFGTNDLTQTSLGFSRDDVERGFLAAYLERGVLERSPFETVDATGVGELVAIAADRGRHENPELKLGICGEHGGDPDSIALFERIGLDYVSCSPARVPIARLAAAQAALEANAATIASDAPAAA